MRLPILETELLDGSILKTSVDDTPRITTRTCDNIELILDAYESPEQARDGHSRLLRLWTADLTAGQMGALPAQTENPDQGLANGR